MDARPQKGTRPFHIAGRLQLSTGEGTWDEWYVGFTDGTWGWLAEAQGGFWLMTPVKPPEVPAFEALSPGESLDLGGYGTFAITEVREATYASAQGELPFVGAARARVFRYADLSGADGSLATLDYGDGPALDGFYVGKPVALESLGIAELVAWSDRTVSVKALALNCPNCGGALQLKDPANTVRIACPFCGSLLGSADRKERARPRSSRCSRSSRRSRSSRACRSGPKARSAATRTRSSASSRRRAPPAARTTSGRSTSSRTRSPRPTTGSRSRTATTRSSSPCPRER